MAEEAPTPPPAPAEEGEAERKVVFAPRIDPTLREQVEELRSITGQTVNQVGEEALQGWVDMKLADENLRAQAMAGIEEEQRRLQERRQRIQRALGTAGTATDTPDKEVQSGGTGRGGRRGKSTGA